ncbi:MAG: hypothetical protein GY711_30695 [bacterium]|nr:hypothetical protein [bacterium]
MKTATSVLASTLLLAIGSGCIVTAAAVTGVAVSQEFIDNANSAYLEAETAEVWIASKSVLTRLALDPIETDEKITAAGANVNGARVTVRVEPFDDGQTKLSVGAKKYGFYQADLADDILNRIRRELR